ncbi:MAG: hypothetical protein ACC662_04310 [Planctomycetota bacterium]
MNAGPRPRRLRRALSILLYGLSGLALLLVFLPVWEAILPFRILIALILAGFLLALETSEWRRQRIQRRERRRRWGASRGQDGDRDPRRRPPGRPR